MTITPAARLERIIGTVLRVGVNTSSVCLACGVALFFVSGGQASAVLLQAGIIILFATPVARVAVSIAQYVNERDWTFTTLTLVVLLELLASVFAALVFHKRL
jgi:uncharacterized membrane protein